MNKRKWLLLTAVLVIAIAIVGYVFRKEGILQLKQVKNKVVFVDPIPWDSTKSGNEAMIDYLKKVYVVTNVPGVRFANNANADFLLTQKIPEKQKQALQYYIELVSQLGNAGRIKEATDRIGEFENSNTFKKLNSEELALWNAVAGVIWMRYGEVFNCIKNHNEESCIWPLSEKARHNDLNGAENSISYFEKALELNPEDLSSVWLMNIAYMQLGKYPQGVPQQWLIPAESFASEKPMPAFENIAADIGVDFPNMCGGIIYEDFNGDNLLDIFTGGWGLTEHCYYLINNGDGTFTDLTEEAGMKDFPGGLHMMHTDYNNDGFPDVFILRGAWYDEYGILPNSLLRNNGDNTFTDVTYESGLFSCHPTQTAVWADFNNDGWLDVFIGNEGLKNSKDDFNYCELYINNKGRFTNIAKEAGVDIVAFIKGVAAGDMDNDGDPDIYISVNGDKNHLFRNDTEKGSSDLRFTNISEEAGISGPIQSFPCWFFDYNNDGLIDIINFSYNANSSDNDIGAEYLGKPFDQDISALYVNNGDGTFTNKGNEVGLNRTLLVMGSSFGDIDNDGWLDFYLGTGKPSLTSIIPNRFFYNDGGKKFLETTVDMKVGHLQKGHAITLSDLNNDGYVEIGAQMGGAYEGDGFQDCLYLNPASFDNNWIAIKLVGDQTNKIAVGAKIILNINDNGVVRKIYRTVGENSSFGTTSLRQTIGVNKASVITSVTIEWPVSGKQTIIRNVPVNQFITISENKEGYTKDLVPAFVFKKSEHPHDHQMMMNMEGM
ncbi:MAG: CRTAC1 family protein [Chitinophagales bacterium]|nr:CRTAC1 family protein [Chitinophagales bacterium]